MSGIASRRRVLIAAAGLVLVNIAIARASTPTFPPAAASEKIDEFAIPTAASNPRSITAGPDGALWFTEGSVNQIGRIGTLGDIFEFPIGVAGAISFGLAGITTGPDGNLWFTESSANRIGRSSTDGDITEFTIPTANSSPSGIAAGADGRLWFTETAANRIGRITPGTGLIEEFPVPSPGALGEEEKIAAGPDGTLWFTEKGANSIGRITPDGAITEFPIFTPAADPDGITAGGDGDLWFSESDVDRIGRITTTGQLTEFPVRTGGADPAGIAAGSDRNLWFVEGDANQIGRITTDGQTGANDDAGEIPIPTANSGAEAITAGPDGNVWFVESAANQIAHVHIAGQYISVGDSYTVGEGLGDYQFGTDQPGLNLCHRSAAGYPSLLAHDVPLVGPATFGGCSGAVTRDFYEAQYPQQPPQLDFLGPAPGSGAVNRDTRIVTLTLGGNDVGFPDVLAACIAAYVPIVGATLKDYGCKDRVDGSFNGRTIHNRGLTWSQVTQMRIDALAGKPSPWPYDTDGKAIRPLLGVLNDIHARAPDATIFLANYPALFGTNLTPNLNPFHPTNECVVFHDTALPVTVSIGKDDVDWIRAAGSNLDDAIRQVATAAQTAGLPVKLVDVTPQFAGQGLCDDLSPWINELHLDAVSLNVETKSFSFTPNPGSFHPTTTGAKCGYEAAFLETFGFPPPAGC